MRALVFAPLAVLLGAVALTVYFASPSREPTPIPPPLTAAQEKALYGPDTPKGQRLIDRANEILAAIQAKCTELRLEYVGPARLDPASVEFSSYSFLREGEIRTVVTFATDDVKLEIVANNGELRFYENLALSRRLENGPFFEPAEKPKLTAPEAIELATIFRKVVSATARLVLTLPTASFDCSGEIPTKTGMKYQQGEWSFLWRHIDEEGHFFNGDQATENMTEGFGPTFIGNNVDTPYHKDTAPIISKESAESAARDAIAEVKWGGESFAAVHLEESTLTICHPSRNYRDERAGFEDEGRLAWSQKFGCELPGSQGGWVSAYAATDAHSGKVINFGMGSGIGEREK